MIPTPSQIAARFERGEIEREELQSLMAVHARELIAEMEEDHRNPAGAWFEGLLAKRAAAQLVRRHGSSLIREILISLSEMEDFPPARRLWNADHPDVPLYCFLRMRREPVFRIVVIHHREEEMEVVIEHGAAARGAATRSRILLQRDAQWRLRATLVE